MWLTERGWQQYHELVCSPGLPWDCEKKCMLWRIWDRQRQEAERQRAAGIPIPTYSEIERKG